MARSGIARIHVGGIAVAALLVLSGCAPGADPEPTAAPETTSPPEPYAGPAIFVGEELEGFLFTADEIGSLLPGSTDIGEPSSVLEQISDGGGPAIVPEVCGALFAEQSLWSVGSRNVSWTTTADSDYRFGRMLALQFADEAHAQARLDQLVDAAAQCASFDYNGPASFESVTPEASDNVRALAGTLTLPEIEGGWSTFSAYAAVGNVLVQVSQSLDGEARPDAEAVAEKLQERAEQARAALMEKLTENPPTEQPEPADNASAPWGDWMITTGGVGPIHLGDPVDEAISAARAAQVIPPPFPGDPSKLVNEAGTSSMLVQATEDGAAVASITVGDARSVAGTTQVGADLPAVDGFRVGAPVADAVAAFPQGTTVSVVSSEEHWYDMASRDGRLLRFHADRDVEEPGATIIGITVEDATKRPLVFG